MTECEVRALRAPDAEGLSAAFAGIGWNKPAYRFLGYLDEEAVGERLVRVATFRGDLAGYVTIQWRSGDLTFARLGIPEIKDLNVVPSLRGRGIASALLTAVEEEIARRGPVAGLRVGLHSGYGAAQRLYVRRGYVPDGAGAVDASGVAVPEGATLRLDDEIAIRLTRRLDGATG